MSKNKARQRARRGARLIAPAKTGRIVEMFPVYRHDCVLGHAPCCFVDKATRDVWVEQGAAEPWNQGKALRLRVNLPPEIQPSQAMGTGVMHGVLHREREALAALAAWTPRDRQDGGTMRMAA